VVEFPQRHGFPRDRGDFHRGLGSAAIEDDRLVSGVHAQHIEAWWVSASSRARASGFQLSGGM